MTDQPEESKAAEPPETLPARTETEGSTNESSQVAAADTTSAPNTASKQSESESGHEILFPHQQQFEDLLSKCGYPSKSKIGEVTKMAIQHARWYKHIVHFVEKFIRSGNTRDNSKIPQLFIIDSIVRNSRSRLDNDPYSKRFGKSLNRTFVSLCKGPPTDRPQIRRVVSLWAREKFWPKDEMKEIIAQIKKFPSESSRSSRPSKSPPKRKGEKRRKRSKKKKMKSKSKRHRSSSHAKRKSETEKSATAAENGASDEYPELNLPKIDSEFFSPMEEDETPSYSSVVDLSASPTQQILSEKFGFETGAKSPSFDSADEEFDLEMQFEKSHANLKRRRSQSNADDAPPAKRPRSAPSNHISLITPPEYSPVKPSPPPPPPPPPQQAVAVNLPPPTGMGFDPFVPRPPPMYERPQQPPQPHAPYPMAPLNRQPMHPMIQPVPVVFNPFVGMQPMMTPQMPPPQAVLNHALGRRAMQRPVQPLLAHVNGPRDFVVKNGFEAINGYDSKPGQRVLSTVLEIGLDPGWDRERFKVSMAMFGDVVQFYESDYKCLVQFSSRDIAQRAMENIHRSDGVPLAHISWSMLPHLGMDCDSQTGVAFWAVR